jgi:hypothetical protein
MAAVSIDGSTSIWYLRLRGEDRKRSTLVQALVRQFVYSVGNLTLKMVWAKLPGLQPCLFTAVNHTSNLPIRPYSIVVSYLLNAAPLRFLPSPTAYTMQLFWSRFVAISHPTIMRVL